MTYLREHGSYLYWENHYEPVSRDSFEIDSTFYLRKVCNLLISEAIDCLLGFIDLHT